MNEEINELASENRWETKKNNKSADMTEMKMLSKKEHFHPSTFYCFSLRNQIEGKESAAGDLFLRERGGTKGQEIMSSKEKGNLRNQ